MNITSKLLKGGSELITGFSALGFLGLVYLNDSILQQERPEAARAVISRKSMCDYISGKLQTVPKINWKKLEESEMSAKLKSFQFALQCTQEEFEFKKFKASHKNVCEDIANSRKTILQNLDQSRISKVLKISPWLLPF